MFDDSAAALPPRAGSSFEAGLRELLASSAAPVTVLLKVPVGPPVELADDFRWHARRPAPAPDALLPGALEWDAQFGAGLAALDQVRAAQAAIGREQAVRARALVAFARSRPASLDRPDAEVGAAAVASRAARPTVLGAVSEWAVDEVAVALSMTGAAASRLLAESLQLVDRLPGTLAALEAGEIHWAHAQVLCDLVTPLPDPVVRAEAERRLLARVAGKTPPQLREAARRVVARLDAEAISRRVAAAVRERGVALYPGEDGMASVAAVLPGPVARAVHDALSRYADAAAEPGDGRSKAQRMADCLVDLVLRPGEHGLAPVQARLTVVAAVQTLLGEGADAQEPGEVDGDLVPAVMVRRLAATLGLLPEEGSAARPTVPEPAPSGTAPAPDRVAALAELLGVRQVAGTALEHRPQLALVDELTGALACLTDAATLQGAARAGRGLGPPPASPGYRPGPGLDRFVRHRDRRCRFPGCRTRATRGDLDHTTPWPAGATSAANLACLCRHHHRLRHQAPGWSVTTGPDGALHWRTPTGRTATTHPPRHGTDDDLTKPPKAEPGAPGRPAPQRQADPDPPPF
ncbi:DUF222 domain-containing protein [Modestobacter sp. URMC 112]